MGKGMIGEREGQRGEGERMRGTGSSQILHVIEAKEINMEKYINPKAADICLLV